MRSTKAVTATWLLQGCQCQTLHIHHRARFPLSSLLENDSRKFKTLKFSGLRCFKENLNGQLNITTCEWSQSLWWSLLVWLVSKWNRRLRVDTSARTALCLFTELITSLLDCHHVLISTKLEAQLRLMGKSWVYRYLVVNRSIGRIQILTSWWRLMMKLVQFNVWSKFNGNASGSSSVIYWQTDHAACTPKIMAVVSFIRQ